MTLASLTCEPLSQSTLYIYCLPYSHVRESVIHAGRLPEMAIRWLDIWSEMDPMSRRWNADRERPIARMPDLFPLRFGVRV